MHSETLRSLGLRGYNALKGGSFVSAETFVVRKPGVGVILGEGVGLGRMTESER